MDISVTSTSFGNRNFAKVVLLDEETTHIGMIMLLLTPEICSNTKLADIAIQSSKLLLYSQKLANFERSRSEGVEGLL